MPKHFHVDAALHFFAPKPGLLASWKQGHLNEHQYIEQYRADLEPVWPQIQDWLLTLDPSCDQTLLCWEPPGHFCHRNLVYKLVETFRPDCSEGQDRTSEEPDNPGKIYQIAPVCQVKPLLGTSKSHLV